MHDIKYLLNNKEKCINLLNRRGIDFTNQINEMEELNLKYNTYLQKEEKLRQDLNNLTTEIKEINFKKDYNSKIDGELINEKRSYASIISNKIKLIVKYKNETQEELINKASFLPNYPLETVKIGKNEESNKVISTHLNNLKSKIKNKLPHWEIIENKNLILKEESNLLSGSRHIVFNNKLAKLIKALELFMIENNESFGYKFVEVPVIVNKEVLYNTAQLPKFEEDLYKISDTQYLIPTAEVPLTNFVANQIINKEKFPIKLTASTNCFRKEAGSAGKDTRGLIRLHQFRKVELVKIGEPSNYKEDFEEMIKVSTNILEKLKLPYRLVELCTGDLSFSAQKTIDIEVWMPGVKKYREISSISIVGDFQARRMKTRYVKDEKKVIPFTYNGSSLAIERTIAAIIENYTDKNGEITIPAILEKYLNFKKI